MICIERILQELTGYLCAIEAMYVLGWEEFEGRVENGGRVDRSTVDHTKLNALVPVSGSRY